MVLGYFCGDNVTLSDDQLIIATRRLRTDFYFFGLMEESTASANLFLAMHAHDGGPPLRTQISDLTWPPFRFTTTRTNKKHSSSAHTTLVQNLTKTGWIDYYDEKFYGEASQIFYERCRQYNISTVFRTIDELMGHMHL